MELTEEIKKKIREHLKTTNEALAKARALVENGKYKEAADAVHDAADAKHLAIFNMPDILLGDGVSIPFSNIYDVFSEVDRVVNDSILKFLFTGELPEGALAKLAEDIETLFINILYKYKNVNSTALDLLDKVVELLTKIKKKMKEKDIHDPDLYLIDDLHAAKRLFLDEVGGEVKLYHIYYRFETIDLQLFGLFQDLMQGDVKPSEEELMKKGTLEWIDSLEIDKKELESYFE